MRRKERIIILRNITCYQFQLYQIYISFLHASVTPVNCLVADAFSLNDKHSPALPQSYQESDSAGQVH